ncbi:MAG: undecaprenyldiphospho-muramoylpentapeptide beta-N-acetylglucosaminyltransferase [Myxococcales bacterium]|nr:undecaprenyldiphospho-muramoylpentapeptide beta-N-acetylglucosaminyltransferase [Myxococcales bacterium]
MTSSAPAKLMVVGGGTGGHLYPGIAVAEAWLASIDGAEVVFVGSPNGLEGRVVPELGYRFIPVEARRLKNAGIVERLKSLVRMPMAILAGYRIIRGERPQVILGVGGYVSGPVVLAAALSGRPSAVAEQNARPGLTNRILAKFVKRVYTAFPEAIERLPAQKVKELGNPVRQDFLKAAEQTNDGAIHVLILGGSQGARSLNQGLPEVIAQLQKRVPKLSVMHQTGRDRDEAVRKTYTDLHVDNADVQSFIDDMATEIAKADLVVARAGATTVAELACIGRAAVFIPFPFAADDHQAANAASLVSAGAALMQREDGMTTERMVDLLLPLLVDRDRLDAMGQAALERGRPQAAASMVDDLAQLSGLGVSRPHGLEECR